MALSDIFNRYSSGLGFGSVEPTLRREAQKFGLSDDELGRATEALGNHILRKYGGGYTNYSSINAIVNGTIQYALNARADPDFYTSPSYSSARNDSSPIAGALNYAAAPEQVFKHWRDDVDFWTSQIPAGYAETGGATWGDEDKNALTRLAIDASSAGKDWNSFIRRFAAVGTGDGSSAWWGPQAKIEYFAKQLGLDPANYVDQARREQQQRVAGEFGTASQQTNAGMGLELGEIAAMAGFLAGGAALGGAFGGLGAGSGTGLVAPAELAGNVLAPEVFTAPLGELAAGAAGSAAPGWTSGQDLLGGADLNFQNMSAPATGGTSGVQAMDWTDFLPSGTDSGGSFLDYLPTDAGPLTDVGSNLNLGDVLQGMSDIPAGAAGSADLMTRLNQIRSLLGLGGGSGGSASGGDSSWMSLLGKIAGPALGAYASNQQANALADIARQYAEYGAPYRAQLAALQSDPGSFLTSPRVTTAVDQGTNAMARALSARDGNPVGSGRALQELQNYSTNALYGQLANRENQLANFGGLSNFNAAAPQTGLASVAQTGNMYNAIGAGINDIFNPQPTYIDLVKAMKGLA